MKPQSHPVRRRRGRRLRLRGDYSNLSVFFHFIAAISDSYIIEVAAVGVVNLYVDSAVLIGGLGVFGHEPYEVLISLGDFDSVAFGIFELCA